MITIIRYLINNLGETPAKIISILFHPVFIQAYLLLIIKQWYSDPVDLNIFITNLFVINIIIPLLIYQIMIKLFYTKKELFAPSKETKIIMIAVNIITLYLLKWNMAFSITSKVLYYLDLVILLNGISLLVTFFYNISLHSTSLGFFIYSVIIKMLILENWEILKNYPVNSLGLSASFLLLVLLFVIILVFISRYRLQAHKLNELIIGFLLGIFFEQIITLL